MPARTRAGTRGLAEGTESEGYTYRDRTVSSDAFLSRRALRAEPRGARATAFNEYLRFDPDRIHPIMKERGAARPFFVKSHERRARRQPQ